MHEQLAEAGIRCTEISDAKFRSCLLELHFFVPRNAQTAPVYALLADLLTATSRAYPARAAFTERLDSLYAADFSGKLTSCGDSTVLTFSAEWLDDALLPQGSGEAALTDAMLSLVYGCLREPNADDGAFDAEEFRICRQNLLDDIDCERNDKRSYALQRTAEIAYAGEPAALPPYGEKAAAEAVTPAQAYAVWQEILLTAPVEAVCVMPQKTRRVRQMLETLFSQRRQTAQLLPGALYAPSPCKAEVRRVRETIGSVQSKLVLVYKYPKSDPDVLRLLNALLGTAPNSLLFAHVREAQGLCYYCSTQIALLKSTLVIDCGIGSEQAEAAEAAIRDQIAVLQAGTFSDALMREALLHLEYGTAVQSDAPEGTADRCLLLPLYGDTRTSAERTAAFWKITREQIMQTAQTLRLDTVYILSGTGGEGEDAT